MPTPSARLAPAALLGAALLAAACAPTPPARGPVTVPDADVHAPTPRRGVQPPDDLDHAAEAAATRAALRRESWKGPGPAPLPGAVLPYRRIVAYYGNPLSKRMGILGEIPPEQMLARLGREVAKWNAADPTTPAVPALHLIAVVAHATPGYDGKYRGRVSDAVVERVAGWARRDSALLFLDIQPGLSTVQEEVPRLEEYLRRPDVHLGLDPEFSMKQGHTPGTRIGTLDAADVNWAIDYLAGLVREYHLPPKVLVIHRFTQHMITNAEQIRPRPEVEVVIDMDGWGPVSLKRQSFRAFVAAEPVQFTGIKLFYRNDTKKGGRLMTPEEVLKLDPTPVYVQYQ